MQTHRKQSTSGCRVESIRFSCQTEGRQNCWGFQNAHKTLRTYLSQTQTLTRFISFLPNPPVLILPFSCCLSSKSCFHVSPNSQWAISSEDTKNARGLLGLGVQAPPSGPVYPSMHLQSLTLVLPGKEELPGLQGRHEAFDTAPTTAE